MSTNDLRAATLPIPLDRSYPGPPANGTRSTGCTADGLRVGQSTSGALTTYAWDWAAPVREYFQGLEPEEEGQCQLNR